MGDYTFMRGTAQIKPENVGKLQQFFALRQEEGTSGDLNWARLPEFLPWVVVYDAWKLLALPAKDGLCIGHWTPFGNSWPEKNVWDDELNSQESGRAGFVALSDDGKLEFSCGFKNYNLAQQAFVALLPVLAADWDVTINWQDCLFDLSDAYERGMGITHYRPNTEEMDTVLDQVVREYKSELERPQREALQKARREKAEELGVPVYMIRDDLTYSPGLILDPVMRNPGTSNPYGKLFTAQGALDEDDAERKVRAAIVWTEADKEKLRAVGLSERFIESLDGPSSELVDVPNTPELQTAWSQMVKVKVERAGIPLDLFTSLNPRAHESFADYCVRLGKIRLYEPDRRTQSLDSPHVGKYDTLLEHIAAHKLFNRGKLGVRQINRKQRRKMRGK